MSTDVAEVELDDALHVQHSAAATPVASPERAEDPGMAALAARRAFVMGAAGESGHSNAVEPSPLPAFESPSEANFGNPLAFASVLVHSSRRRQNANGSDHQHSADAPAGDESSAGAAPQMNSTLRLAAKLDEVKRESPAADAIAQVRAAARPARNLLNFSMNDRKYGCLTPLEPSPEDQGPNADLPPVRILRS